MAEKVNCQSQIDKIAVLIQKKKLSKAKTALISLTYQLRISYQNSKFDFPENQLKFFNHAYKCIWKNGVTYNNDFKEWQVLCSLGWLQTKNLKMAKFYFEHWFYLMKTFTRKKGHIPKITDYHNIRDDFQVYFEYIETYFDFLYAIKNLEVILDLSNIMISEEFAMLLSMLGYFYSKIENPKFAIKLYKQSNAIRRKIGVFQIASDYFVTIQDIAKTYKNQLKDFDKSLKWYFKLHEAFDNVAITNQRTSKIEMPFHSNWLDCQILTAMVYIDGFENTKQAEVLLVQAGKYLKQHSRELQGSDPNYSEITKNRIMELVERCTEIQNRKEPKEIIADFENQIEIAINLSYSDKIDEVLQSIEQFENIQKSIEFCNFVNFNTRQRKISTLSLKNGTRNRLYLRICDGIFAAHSKSKLYLEGVDSLKTLTMKLRPCSKTYAYTKLAELLLLSDNFKLCQKYLKKADKQAKDFRQIIAADEKYKKLFRLAKSHFGLRNFSEALKLFQYIVDHHKGFENEASFGIFECYFQSRQYSIAKQWLKHSKPNPTLKIFTYKFITSFYLNDSDKEVDFINLLALFQLQDEKSIWTLCHTFEGLKDHFQLAFPIFGSLITTTNGKPISKDEETKEAHDLCLKFDLTKNSFYFKEFFKTRIVQAKNE